MGRTSKLTEELTHEVVRLIEDGNYDETAYRSVGISHETFYRWLREGEAANTGKKREFYEAVERARGRSETTLLSTIKSQSPSDWKAAAWILERRFSSRWANKQKVEVAVADEFEAMMKVLEEGLEPHVFRDVCSALAGNSS